MKDVVFNEIVSGRRIMVFKHTKPWPYYTGYIQLYPLDDPAEWIAQVNNRNEDYFDRLDEFSNFPYGVTYAGNLSMDGEWWVGFDTASAPIGSIDEEDCIDALKATALILKIRSNAVKDTVEEKLSDAGAELIKYLVVELGMDTADIMLYGLLKDVLDDGEDDE